MLVVITDFCDPQGGKGACDRKSASLKCNIKVYLNSGSNIETSDEMKETIQSFGGMSSCGSHTAPTFSNIKLEGVSSISNVEYSDKGMRIWRAYKIGQGKLISWEKLNIPDISGVPCLTDVNKEGITEDFTSVKETVQRQATV